MPIENLPLMQLTDMEASIETLADMGEQFDSFEKVGLDGLFAYFERGEGEI